MNHLDKDILIHVCQDRTITYRTKDEPVFNGVALPVWSVDTKARAEAIITLLCVRNHEEHPLLPGQNWYSIPMENQYLQYSDLAKVTQKFKDADEWLEREIKATDEWMREYLNEQ